MCCNIYDSWVNGKIEIFNAYVYLNDEPAGSFRYYDNVPQAEIYGHDYTDDTTSTENITLGTLIVTGSSEDTEGPAVTNIAFDKKEVSPGETVNVTIDASDPSGTKCVQFLWEFTGTDAEQGVYHDILEGMNVEPDEDGKFTAEIKVDDTWKNGIYNVGDVTSEDGLGNVETIFAHDTDSGITFEGFTVSGSSEDDPSQDTENNNEQGNTEYDDSEYTRGGNVYSDDDIRFFDLCSKYIGYPFVTENENGENLTGNTRMELYKIIDGKEVRVQDFVKAEVLLNPDSRNLDRAYGSSFTHYRVAPALASPGEYVIKCVSVPEGYEKFNDIRFTVTETYEYKGAIKNIVTTNGDKAFIADKDPDYIKEKNMRLDRSADDFKALTDDEIMADMYDLYSLYRSGETASGKNDAIAESYDLFTIVLKKSPVKNGTANTSGVSSGNKNTANVVSYSGSAVTNTSAAPTGDMNSAVWFIAAGITAASAGLITYFRKRHNG